MSGNLNTSREVNSFGANIAASLGHLNNYQFTELMKRVGEEFVKRRISNGDAYREFNMSADFLCANGKLECLNWKYTIRAPSYAQVPNGYLAPSIGVNASGILPWLPDCKDL